MTIKLPGTYTLTLLAGLSPNAPMLKFYHLSTLDVMYVTKRYEALCILHATENGTGLETRLCQE